MWTLRTRFHPVKPYTNATFRATRPRRSKIGGQLMRTKLTLGTAILAGAALVLSQTPLWAHHAFAAEFDGNKPVKFIDAVVTKVQLINPHSWIYVDVKGADGKMENWAIEAGSPNILMRRG